MLSEVKMKECIYKSYDELPLIMNAQDVADALGITIFSAYELMKDKTFPSKRAGCRTVVTKEKFWHWLETEDDVKIS